MSSPHFSMCVRGLSSLIFRFVLVTALALSAVNICCGYDLRIGIIGDQAGAVQMDYAYVVLSKGISKLNNHSPDVVIHVGDLVESDNPQEQVINLYNKAAGIMNRLKVSWYLTPGDHDVFTKVMKNGSRVCDPDNHNQEKLF